MRDPDPILLTGASGYVGSHLLDELLRRGRRVRALMRDPAPGKLPAEVERAGATPSPERARGGARGLPDGLLPRALDGPRAGPRPTSPAATARRRVNFGRRRASAGVERIIYLGGLEGDDAETSEHLRRRHEVAEILREHVPELVYVRAAMVIGAGSASFEMLRALVSACR